MKRVVRLAVTAIAVTGAVAPAAPAAARPIRPPVCMTLPSQVPDDICLPDVLPGHKCVYVPDLEGHVWEVCFG